MLKTPFSLLFDIENALTLCLVQIFRFAFLLSNFKTQFVSETLEWEHTQNNLRLR